MEHQWYQCICKRPQCRFCDGSVKLCGICLGLGESLTTECCGRPITHKEDTAITAGTLDFVGDVWVVKGPGDANT